MGRPSNLFAVRLLLALVAACWVCAGAWPRGGQLIRNVIQVVPLLLATWVIARRPDWTWPFTMPLFCWWACGAVYLWFRWLWDSEGTSEMLIPVSAGERALVTMLGMAALAGALCALRMSGPQGVKMKGALVFAAAVLQTVALMVGALTQRYLAVA